MLRPDLSPLYRSETANLREQVARGLLLAAWCYGHLIVWKGDVRRVFGVRAQIVDDVFAAFEQGGLMKRTGTVSRGGTEWTILSPETWPGVGQRDGALREATEGLPRLCQIALHRVAWNLRYGPRYENLVEVDSEPCYISDGAICVGEQPTGMVWRRGLFAHLRNGRYLHFMGAPPGGVSDMTDVVLAELKALEEAEERDCWDFPEEFAVDDAAPT